MTIIAINKKTGDYVKDLGMKGEYPYSSSVGREVCFAGQKESRWFPTEINPSGQTVLEQKTLEWMHRVDPSWTCQVFNNNYNGCKEVVLKTNGDGTQLTSNFPYSFKDEVVYFRSEHKGEWMLDLNEEDKSLILQLIKDSDRIDECDDEEWIFC